jgi:hypothetical protein
MINYPSTLPSQYDHAKGGVLFLKLWALHNFLIIVFLCVSVFVVSFKHSNGKLGQLGLNIGPPMNQTSQTVPNFPTSSAAFGP